MLDIHRAVATDTEISFRGIVLNLSTTQFE